MNPLDFIWGAVLIALFLVMRRVYLRTHIHLLHPVLVTTVLLVIVAEAMGGRYDSFKAGTNWLAWLLGPAVVGLAVPVYRLRQLIFSHLRPLALILPVAVLFGFFSMWLVLRLGQAPHDICEALGLKSITVPITLEIMKDRHGNLPAAAIGTMFASILGGSLGPLFLRWFGVTDSHAIGLALGSTSHGVGTARAYELGPIEGAYASVGMICSGILAALIFPTLLVWLG
jgi:putative effector of murein hydrolase